MTNPIKRIAIAATAIASIAATSASAQTANYESGATLWSLDSCINYAISHNLTVENRRLEVTGADYAVTEAKDRFLPTLSAQAGESFSFGRGLTSDNTYANRNTENFNVGIGMNLPIFQGLAGVRRVKSAEASLTAAILQLEAEKDNIELNVMAQYLQALYTAEVVKVAREQLRMSEFELARRHSLLEAGKIPELDIAEARAQVASDRSELVSATNEASLALLDLKLTLRLDDRTPFAVDTVIKAPTDCQMMADENSVIDNALRFNHSIAASRAGIVVADRNIDLARSAMIPTLSFNAGLNTNYYRLGGMPNPAFHTQMRDNFSKYLGFTLNIPIFDGLSTRNSVRRAKLQRRQAEIACEEATDRVRRAVTEARLQATNSSRRFQAATEAERSALEAFEGMEQKYNFGKASATDYETARSRWIRARLQAIQSYYESLLRMRILAFYNRR